LSSAASSRSGNLAADAWAGILNAGRATPLFFARVADLTALVAEVRALVEDLPDTEDPELIVRHYDQVDGIVANFIHVGNINMNEFMEPLKDTGLISIEMADRALRRRGHRESRLEQSELDRLRDEVHDLISDVLGADSLAAEQKRSIVAHLRAVEDTLTCAFLSDADLIHATDGLVGAMLALPRRAWDNHAVRGVAKFAATVVAAVAVNLATTAVENAIEAPKPPSVVLIERIAHGEDIPAISSGQPHDEVVDAQVIDDDQPDSNRRPGWADIGP
jgi:hypothetical protein